MEAANRGAADAGGRSIGLNISLPHEQRPNPYITPGLAFEFHYFFMRKLWFAHLAKALIVFPGGFGTLDELMEILTLAQTHKLERKIPILLYGESYWREIINFEALVRHEVISQQDLELFTFIDEPGAALAHLQRLLTDLYRARNTRIRALKAHRVSIIARLGRVDEVCICHTMLRAPSLECEFGCTTASDVRRSPTRHLDSPVHGN